MSYDFEMKRKKTLLLQEKKEGRGKFYLRPPGIEHGPTGSESYVLITLPSMHMVLTRDQAQNTTCD